MQTSHLTVGKRSPHVVGHIGAVHLDSPRCSTVSRFQRVWSHPRSRWIRDGLVLGYFLSGGPLYDQRLAITPGVSLNQVLGALCLAIVGVSILSRPRFVPGVWSTVSLVAVLTTVVAVRSIGSPDPHTAHAKSFGHMFFILPVILYVQWNTREQQDVVRCLKLWCLAAAAMAVLSVPHMIRIQEGQRLSILAGGPNVFARIIGTGAFCSVLLFRLCDIDRRWRWHYLLWLPLAGVAILLAGTKAAFAGLVLAGMTMLWSLKSRRVAGTIAMLFVILCALPLATHSRISHLPKDGGVVRLLRLPDLDDPEGSFGSRLRYARGSLGIIREQPWFGIGTGAWGRRAGIGNDMTYPHNILLEVLTELGFTGLVLICLPLAWFPRRRQRAHARTGVLQAGLLGLVVFWLVNVQLSGDLVDSRPLWFFLLLMEIATSGFRSVVQVSDHGEDRATTAP